MEVGLVSSPPLFDERWLGDFCGGETLRLVALLFCEAPLPLVTLDVLAIPCRQDRMRSEGAFCEAAEVLPSRKLGWLALVAIETPAMEFARLDVPPPPPRLPKTEPLSQSSPFRLFHAQSWRKILIVPVKSAVTMMLPLLCKDFAVCTKDSLGRSRLPRTSRDVRM